MNENNLQLATSPLVTTNGYVHNQIEMLRTRIDIILSDSTSIPFQIEEVLSYLKQAEKLVNEDPSQAWYQLAKAKIALHESSSISMADLVEGDAHILRQELYKVWHELNDVQKRSRHVNTTNAADWLMWGEQALNGKKIDKARAMYCIMRARYSLGKAQEFSEWDKYGYFAIALESLYLILLPVGIMLYSRQTNMLMAEMMSSRIFQVPFFVFVWGFLGGVSWSVYSAAYWSKRRLFDRHYLPWYLAHPWISAVLGGAVSLVVLGGLASFGSMTPEVQPTSSILALVSFISGFSTNSIWKLLDRTVRKMLDVKGSSRNIHEEAHEDTLEGHKPG